jgi:hypothetical protein
MEVPNDGTVKLRWMGGERGSWWVERDRVEPPFTKCLKYPGGRD